MMTRNTAPAVGPDGFLPGSTLDRRSGEDALARFADTTYDSTARTIDIVISSGSRVRRWGIYEELAISPEAVDLARVTAGQVCLLDSHNQDSIDRVFGALETAWFENGLLMGRVRFAETEAGRRAEGMVSRGEVRGISAGYRVTRWALLGLENDTEIWRAEAWELYEASLVAVPADPAARTRSAGAAASIPPTTETDDMRRNAQAGDAPAPVPVTTQPVVTEQTQTRAVDSAAPASAPAAQPDLAAERRRMADIMEIGTRHSLDNDLVTRAISGGLTVDQFRASAFDALAARQAPASHIRIERDETETRRSAMQDSIARRLGPITGDVPAATRGYMDFSLVEMAAERLGERRVPGSFGAREEMLRRAFHSTTDFPILFEGALNTALAARYRQATPTYRRIARQRTYVDFRDHNTVRAGDFPDLQPVNPDGGEIKAGTFGESKEKTSVKAYGVTVGFSRQMLVNDSLDALRQVLNDRGVAVARFEDRTFYAMMLSASGAGPTLLETTRAVFNTTDGSLAGTAAAISVASVSLGRAALRKRKSKDGAELELAAAIMLVGPDKETEAQQLLAPIQAQQAGNVNPFSGALSLEVTAKITNNAWYLFAAPDEAACFEWGLLDGYSAPRFRTEEPFGTQGVSMSLEHDFGCGAIDFRGGYRNAGA